MIQFPKPVSSLISALNRAGHEAYAVGGCVRDALLSIPPNDWDLTTSAAPEAIKACFPGFRIIETGIKHGTVTVMVAGEPYEITTYRKDGAYTDHRRPDSVEFVGDLREDLMRRDFTINAMACHPDTGLVDYFQGAEDLKKGVIRCVGDPEARFTEDALRILRALRFSSRFDFAIDPATAEAALRLSPTLSHVSEERILSEIKKLLCGKGVERALLTYPGLLFAVLPELAPMYGCAQNNPHHAYDVWTHTVKTIAAAPRDEAFRLAMLFHDSGKPRAHTVGEDGFDHFKGHPVLSEEIALSALTRLKSDKATLRKVCFLVREHDLRAPANAKNVKKQMARLGADNFESLLPVLRADLRGQNPALRAQKEAYVDALERAYREVLAENACLRITDLAIRGNDVTALGARGPKVGEILQALLESVISEKVENERGALLREAEKMAREALHPSEQ